MSTVTTVLAVSASAWGVAMALSPVLQIRTMVSLRSSRGISLGYLPVLLVGFALWLGYGLALLMLVSTGYIFFWAPLVFPLWALLVSVSILLSDLKSVPVSGS